MSSDLLWMLVKDHNSFLVKRNGFQFSKEPNNLTNLNTRKFSGLANTKTVGIVKATGNKRGYVVALKSQKNATKPQLSANKITLSKGVRPSYKSVRNLLHGYRPDLRKFALARVTALNRKAVKKTGDSKKQ